MNSWWKFNKWLDQHEDTKFYFMLLTIIIPCLILGTKLGLLTFAIIGLGRILYITKWREDNGD